MRRSSAMSPHSGDQHWFCASRALASTSILRMISASAAFGGFAAIPQCAVLWERSPCCSESR